MEVRQCGTKLNRKVVAHYLRDLWQIYIDLKEGDNSGSSSCVPKTGKSFLDLPGRASVCRANPPPISGPMGNGKIEQE